MNRHLPTALALHAMLRYALIAAVVAPAAMSSMGATNNAVSVNFVNTEIDAVARAISVLLDRTIVVDPRVKGSITLYNEKPRTPAEVYVEFLAALRGLGFTVVEVGSLLKVVPESEAKLQSGVVALAESPRRGDQILTKVFRLAHESANNLIPVLRPLISPNNTINAGPGNSTLVVTDYADNLVRIATLIAALDLPPGGDVDVIELRHAIAAEVLPLVQRLVDGGGATGTPPAGAAASPANWVQAAPRGNALLLRISNPARLASMRSLIDRLDRPAAGDNTMGDIQVVPLKHADAVKLATVVRAAFGGGSAPASLASITNPSPSPAAPPGSAATPATTPLAASAAPSVGGFVQADPSTNALIITGPEPLQRQLRAVIERLDTRRAQVYIEALVVEVAADNAADVGFQWQGLIGKSGDSAGVALGTNFGTTGNIVTLSTAENTRNVSVGEGLNIALLHKYGSAYGLAAVARLLQSQANTNIVSTPNLITLDNEEAKIVVGSNVPFITGQSVNQGAGGAATSSPFQTVERKDVGITMRIRPQIGDGSTVRLNIYQEASSLSEKVAPGTSNAGPSTNKRSIETNVVVDDGELLVIGGLIEDRYTDRNSKVPLLGDMPWLGALFRSESRTKTRTNLIVFLRPLIVRDRETASTVSRERHDEVRQLQQRSQPQPHRALPIDNSPVLPPAP
jgi:general secretion pathway protein D